MQEIRYDVPYLKDAYGQEHPSTGIMKDIEFQPKTGDVFYTIKIINVDRCSMRNLFLFMNEAEMNNKYEELWQNFAEQQKKIMEEKKKWI